MTYSEILDYLSQEDVEQKIETLLAKDRERREERLQEFEEVMHSSLPPEEKEQRMKNIMNARISGQETVEKEQRLAALQVRSDYAKLKKFENEAFNALVAGNRAKYDRAINQAATIADQVDMGLEFIENAPKFFDNFRVTKVRLLSKEEAAEHERQNPDVIRLKNVSSLF